MVKEIRKFDQERRDWSTCFLPISGHSQKETLGVFWHWQVCITNPPTGFLTWVIWGHHGTSAPHLFCTGCVIHSHKHTIELVQYSRKSICWKNKELEFQASLPCPEESQTNLQNERLLLNHKGHWDSKLSLSLSYFNKTLLHKSSEWSSLVTGLGLNSSPQEAKNPSVFHGSATTFHKETQWIEITKLISSPGRDRNL